MHKRKKAIILTMVIAATSGLALTAFITDGDKKTGVDKASMDLSVSPAQDFYQYANGTWVKKKSCSGRRNKMGKFRCSQRGKQQKNQNCSRRSIGG